MTPEQRKAITDCATRITSMRHSGHHDSAIKAALIVEGWPRAAVDAAFEAVKGETP